MAEKDAMDGNNGGAIRVSGMQFSYESQDPVFFDFNLDLLAGSRCLLVGANGSGKYDSNNFVLFIFIWILFL